MPHSTRYLGLALIPLLAFLAMAGTGQAWFEKEMRRLQADAIAARQAQFIVALAIIQRPPETWDDAFQRELGKLLGGSVTLETAAEEATSGKTLTPGHLAFDYPFPGTAGLHARVTFPAPAANRLIVLHQRMFTAVVLLALVSIVVSALLPFCYRPARETDSHTALPGVRSEILGLEHFARISVERGEALRRETGARHRAEEDLQVSRALLDRSMQERAQLGRNLHDNICQTLYAVSLSLEGVRRTAAGAGSGTTGLRLDQCIAELRRLNHEVRSYLKELEPDGILRQPFMEALESMLAGQSRSEGPKLVHDLQPDATGLITPEQTPEVVNVLREAVSNSIQHGRAQTITLQARRGEDSVVFAVQDDGLGFECSTAGGRGHGLANMQARAAALGGSVKIVSAPGKGTRVLLSIPVASEIRDKSEI
jgi:signal transduction histidine kinase